VGPPCRRPRPRPTATIYLTRLQRDPYGRAMPGGDRDDDDAPRWELPVYDPSEEIPRWEPERDVRREVPRWQPARAQPSTPRAGMPRGGAPRPSATRAAAALPAREPPKRVPFYAAPFAWWTAHPWPVLWAFVLLAPVAALALRVLDEAALTAVVTPAAWGLVLLFAIALALALMASARRSALRLVLGGVGALVTLAVLLWPVTRVTLGRTICPARAGPDLGAGVAASALEAWQGGNDGDGGWRQGRPDDTWQERTRAAGLVDYQLLATGCWERVAPIDTSRTWHEFRVTVQDGDREPLSKTVVVHTDAGGDGWKITAIEGPLP
jgi:hypothetical protein